MKVLFANRQPIRVISDISRRQIFFAQGGQREFAEPRLRVFGCEAENLCELGRSAGDYLSGGETSRAVG